MVIGFHKPDEPYGFMSNWYMADFTVNGLKFCSMEQYMMYMKALTFNDRETADKIITTADVRSVKALGRQVKNYDDRVWDGLRQMIVYEGLLAKFSQNADLRKKLLATGDAVLAECAYSDLVWGIGRSPEDPGIQDRSKWAGRNLLGYALMMVRSKLR